MSEVTSTPEQRSPAPATDAGADSTPATPKPGLTPARIAALVAVVVVSVGAVLLGDRVNQLSEFGYAGMFVFNVLTSATIILPVPALVVVFSMGAVLSPFWVGVASALGSTVGELSGYGAGFSGQAVIENVEVYDRIVAWTRKYGVLPVVVLAFIPNPIFDLAGIAAGALRMPLHHFLLASLAGKLPKMWVFAYAGFFSLDWVMGLLG